MNFFFVKSIISRKKYGFMKKRLKIIACAIHIMFFDDPPHKQHTTEPLKKIPQSIPPLTPSRGWGDPPLNFNTLVSSLYASMIISPHHTPDCSLVTLFNCCTIFTQKKSYFFYFFLPENFPPPKYFKIKKKLPPALPSSDSSRQKIV